ncbi:MAG: glycosyltransferase [Sphingobium sp.]
MSGAGKVAIYLPDLSGGGAERLHVQLAPALESLGYAVRFVLDRPGGALEGLLPSTIARFVLGGRRQLAALPRLVRYLRQDRPDILVGNMEHMNVMAVLARRLARVPTRVVVTQHNAFSEQVKRASWQWRVLPPLYRAILPRADAVVAVSAGVADDLAERTGFPRDAISVIHNGVIDHGFFSRAAEEPQHRWFAEGRRVIVGMGRLVAQKDFATLVRAFALAPQDTRLLILGEGPQRAELEALAASLDLAGRVDMPGFLSNPLPFLRKASLFVLSSRFEGFGNVVAEALALGTPVVSTDCPHGPAEILQAGRFGLLVPPGDSEALGVAITHALAAVPDHEALSERGRHFSVSACAQAYSELWEGLGAGAARFGAQEAGASARFAVVDGSTDLQSGERGHAL